MIISTVVDLFCCQPKNCHVDKDTVKNIAYVLDWITALALLIIGCLAVTGVIPLSPAASWALLGAGVVYTAIMVLSICKQLDISCGRPKRGL